ncbi:bacillithiol biosynthesis cysteine-adding enzyme BshC [Paenibacillus spongiae]|uniref:Putative cysteine ligase BshC n=1 Tax=Paenibacillus spongiae TaxID=2909671 RepID=A0ABY5SF71_9BACL|nr:bacillithiol biosynthesis cysteine-adding enzyme BshC [Paenibacillus spongiae]UVI32183.1 bacillithiol biosynthesis cysteine-adding enzyme BshC [Paenibacillus spongiae]
MEIELFQLPAGQPLAAAYSDRTDRNVINLFGGHPEEEESWRARAAALAANADSRVPAKALADTLRSYNARFNDCPEVHKGIDAIGEGAPVIVGGQQAGLWTGPLLVIHKAVTVIQAARFAARKLGTPVIPVFWIAGEDHDWDEVNHALVATHEQGIKKIAMDRPPGIRTSVSQTKLSKEAMNEAVTQLSVSLEDTEFKQDLIGHLATYAESSETLTEWFAYLMGRLFGKYGLVLLDSDDPSIRRLEAPMFKRMIERNDELEEAYTRGAAAVRELGYAEQAEVAPGGANLFLYHMEEGEQAGERTLLFKRSGRFKNRKGTLSMSREELLGILEKTPERFSNNVLTRPLMQDYVLPVLGTVLGNGEIAYWSLTAEAFRTFGMQMPIIVPRMSFTLIEGAVAKHMAKYDLSFEDVIFRFEARKQAWLKERDELSIEERFEEMKLKFAQLYDPLIEMAASVQAGLAELGVKNKRRIAEQIAYMETRTKDAHAQRFDAALRQLERISLSLWPAGKPQERVFNLSVYWNRYGTEWIGDLLAIPYDPSGGHRLVYIN